MDKSKQNLDRVRPILQAMERSIDAARAQRMRAARPLTPESPATPPPPSSTSDQPTDQPTRLRARPKRSTPMSNFDDRAPIRPQPPADRD